VIPAFAVAPPAGVRVLIATRPVDFRRGADGLAATVQTILRQDPFCGTIFVFRSKRADRVKMLVYDGTGLVLIWKRLEGARFKWPAISDGVMRLSGAQLAALFEGLDWRRVYAPGRSAEHAVALLKDFTGVLQTDGYAAYRRLADPKRNTHPVALAYCWAHCRRQFFDIAKTAPAPIATEALRRIAELYEIEAETRGSSADERRAARQQKTKPLIEALKTWLEKTLVQVPGRSNIAKAIRYALKQWEGLIRFLDDGRIEIDSNTVERAMRPVALTRKNALFAGSDEGAENWAMLASLIETCKLHGVNPEDYFTDVLTKLVNNWPNSRLAELLPWAWTAEAR